MIDDECDYYQTNSVWLSNTEREKLEKHENEMRAKKHGSRLNRKITLDFAGREVVDEGDYTDDTNDSLIRSIVGSKPTSTTMSSNTCPTMEFDQPQVRREISLSVSTSFNPSLLIPVHGRWTLGFKDVEEAESHLDWMQQNSRQRIPGNGRPRLVSQPPSALRLASYFRNKNVRFERR